MKHWVLFAVIVIGMVCGAGGTAVAGGAAGEQFSDALVKSWIQDCGKRLKQDAKAGDAFYERGCYAYALGDHQQALADFSEVIRLGADAGQSYIARAMVHLDQQDEAAAVADLDQAIALYPTNPVYRYQRIVLNYRLQNYSKLLADVDLLDHDTGAGFMLLLSMDLQNLDLKRYLRFQPDASGAAARRALMWHNWVTGLAFYDAGKSSYDRLCLITGLTSPTRPPSFMAFAKYEDAFDAQLQRKAKALTEKTPEHETRWVLYDQAIQENPDSVAPYLARGAALADAGRRFEAAADYQQAVAISPDDSDLHFAMGKFYAGQADFGAAGASFTKAITLRPDFAEAYYERGLLWYCNDPLLVAVGTDERNVHKIALTSIKAALVDLDRALLLQPTRPITKARAIVAGELARLEKPLADLDATIAAQPNDASAYYRRGALRGEYGAFEAALADLDRAAALDPQQGQVYYQRGLAHEQWAEYQMKLYPKLTYADYPARQAIIANLEPTLMLTQEIANAYVEDLPRQIAAGRAAAIRDYVRAACLQPEFAAAHAALGRVNARLAEDESLVDGERRAKRQAAVAAYSAYLKLQPNDIRALCARGALYASLNQPKQALRDAEKALVLAPNFGEAYMVRSEAYDRLDNGDQAYRDYMRAVSLNERYKRTAKAWQDSLIEEYQSAQSQIRESSADLQKNPQVAAAYASRAAAYHTIRSYSEAIADYNEAIALLPGDAALYYGRGKVYVRLKKPQSALADYSQALTLNPERELRAVLYAKRGKLFLASGHDREAAADFSQAIRLDGQQLNLEDCYVQRGLAYHRLGETELARQDFLAAAQRAYSIDRLLDSVPEPYKQAVKEYEQLKLARQRDKEHEQFMAQQR